MPKFEIHRVFEFIPGPSESIPPDLLDDKGELIQPLAWWPVKPFTIESADEKAALHWAEREWIRQERAVCLDARIPAKRFVELQDRKRPGGLSDRDLSVQQYWGVKEESGPWNRSF